MANQSKIFLRKPMKRDVSIILSWENKPQNKQFSSFDEQYVAEDIEALIESNDDIQQNKQVRWIVTDQSEIALGAVDLYEIDFNNATAGVGILIDESHRRKGFAKMAISLIEEFALRRLELTKLFCEIPVSNTSSIDLFEVMGYKLIEKRKNQYEIDSLLTDVYFYEKKIQ